MTAPSPCEMGPFELLHSKPSSSSEAGALTGLEGIINLDSHRVTLASVDDDASEETQFEVSVC